MRQTAMILQLALVPLAPGLTAAARQLRDQFQWLHDRDLIIKVMFAWCEDCDPNASDK